MSIYSEVFLTQIRAQFSGVYICLSLCVCVCFFFPVILGTVIRKDQ